MCNILVVEACILTDRVRADGAPLSPSSQAWLQLGQQLRSLH